MQVQFLCDTDAATAFLHNLSKAGKVSVDGKKWTFENKSLSATFRYVAFNGILLITVHRKPVLADERILYAYFSKFLPHGTPRP